MERRTKIIIGSVLAVSLVGGAAFAANGYSKMKKGRAMMRAAIVETDTNSDKAISKEELMAALKTRFDAADANSDAAVSKSELVAMMESNKEVPFLARRSGRISDRVVNQFDLNENGQVTMVELESRASKFFAVADWNDDGKVEMAEVRKMRGMMRGGHRRGKHRGGWFGGGEASKN